MMPVQELARPFPCCLWLFSLSLCPAMPAATLPLALPLSAYGCVWAGLVSLSLCHDVSLSRVPTVSPAAILVTRLQQGRLYNTHEKFSGG